MAQKLGRYVLLERLGQGSTAEAWKIDARGPGGFSRIRVGKRLLPARAADAGFVALLVEEAKLSARLDHANLVRVFDLEHIDGEYLLTMEHVDGCELRVLLGTLAEQGTPPPVGLGLYVVHEIARGLQHAHAATDERGRALGLVHRDVSPSNILLSKDGAAKLGDFGVAHASAQRAGGAVQGNLAYMAPEQLANAPLDARADLYALGVVLHECLTAKRLWKGAYDVESMRLLRTRPIAPPSLSNPAVTAELDALCARATAEHVEDRFASARELADAAAVLLGRTPFGATELAALIASSAPRKGSVAAPQRRTLTSVQPRSSRVLAVTAGVAVLALGALAWRTHGKPATVAVTAPAAATAPAAVTASAAVTDTVPATATAAPPARRVRSRKPARTDLVQGTLVDPFKQ